VPRVQPDAVISGLNGVFRPLQILKEMAVAVQKQAGNANPRVLKAADLQQTLQVGLAEEPGRRTEVGQVTQFAVGRNDVAHTDFID